MPTYQLIYRSQAAAYYTDDQLLALLEQCRQNNQQQHISGILLYGHGMFTQLLEGPTDPVRELYYQRIARDPRHSNPTVLQEGLVSERLFESWAMAFRPLDANSIREISGYVAPEGPSPYGRNLLAPLRLLALIQGFARDIQS